jgi:hypothetical protein
LRLIGYAPIIPLDAPFLSLPGKCFGNFGLKETININWTVR